MEKLGIKPTQPQFELEFMLGLSLATFCKRSFLIGSQEIREIIPFPVTIIPFPVFKTSFGLFGKS